MNNNYSEQIFQAIDTIILQRLNEVSFDKTEICKIVEQNQNYPHRYWVTNDAGLKYEAYATDDMRKYSKGQKVYVTIPQGNYELRKLIIGAYSTDELPSSLYVNPFNYLVPAYSYNISPITIQTDKIGNHSSDKQDIAVEFHYINDTLFDYLGLEFSLDTSILQDTYKGTYSIELQLYNELDEQLNTSRIVLYNTDLYGNPYGLIPVLRFQHLFPFPQEITDITNIKKVRVLFAQDGNFEQEGSIVLQDIKLHFGYNNKLITQNNAKLFLNKQESLRYTTNTTNKNRTLYLQWQCLDNLNVPIIFNEHQPQPTIFNEYTVYWLHYVDGLGANPELPDDVAWNWEKIASNTDFNQTILLTTNYNTDQYKVVIKYKYAETDEYQYIASNGIMFENEEVRAEPGATNNSEDTLRIKLNENDTGVYNIYGLDGRMMDYSYRGPHNIYFEFLDTTPLDRITSINWEFPSENTMIKDVADIDKQQATFNIDTMYKPGAMNNRIWCTVTLVTGEIRRGSLTLQFGEAAAAGSNYAFNIDFIGHRTCLYATGKEDSVEIQAIFTKQNGEVMTVPTITWSWMNDYNSPITLSSSTGEKITLTYNNSEVPEENYSILQAKINDYAIDNGLTTNLTAYLPIPIAKPEYNYISGATRVVYDSNGNTATYSRNPYELYNLTKKIENTSWDIISNSTNDTFQLKTQNIRDKNGNITGEEKTLLPLSYIPQKPPMTCVYCILNGNIVWSQPILIIQNRWEYDLLNKWNGKLTSDGKNYVLAPLLGAGKKEDDNGFTGVLMGDLRTAKGQLSETGLYGFKEGSRRFSFNDKGEAYIGTGDYYIDFNNENLKISTKLFDLKSEHIEINENGLIVNNGGNFIVKDKNNISRLFFDGSTGYLTLRGAIKGSGSDYCEIGTDSNNYNGFYYHHPKRSTSREVFKIWPGYSGSNYSRMVISSDNGIAFSRTITPNTTNADGTQGYTHTLIIDYNNSYMYGKWNLDDGQYFTGNIKTSNSLAICRSSNYNIFDLHLWATETNGIIQANNGYLSLEANSDIYLEASNNIYLNGYINSSEGADIRGIEILSFLNNGVFFDKSPFYYGAGLYYDGRFSFYPITSNSTVEEYTYTYWDERYGTLNVLSNGGRLYGTWTLGSSTAIQSDYKAKHSIITLSEDYNNFFNLLNPCLYKYNNGTSDRYHTGFIAQEVENALAISAISTIDFAGLVIDYEEEEKKYYLRYDEFIALNTWQIQKLKTRVSELENEIKELKQNYEI